jgi:hypothetical protein
VNRILKSALALAVALGARAANAAIIPVVEDVMTSSFFTGTNLVRGYPGDNRPTMRVSTLDPFGTPGAETVYLTFAPADIAALTSPAPSARLTVQSISGGFGADADAANPFQISAHAVNANPLTSITDDTNPGGPIAWNTFYDNNILPAAPAATTTVSGFGAIEFDVTAIVNDWISGANTVYAIALTGKNHVINDGEYLHGIRNNNDSAGSLGSSFLTVVPEPATGSLVSLCLVVLGRRARQRRLSAR